MAPHVAVVTFPFSSHAAVLLSFARALADAAPAATFSFLSTADSVAQLRRTAAAAPPGNVRFVEVEDGAPPEGTPVPRRMEMFMEAAEAGGVERGLEAARAAAGGARVTCVAGDAFLWMAAEAAAKVGAKWVPVWTGASSALVAHLRTDALREDVGEKAASRADELLASHPGLESYRIRDLPDGVISGDFNYVISLLLHRMAQRLPRAATAIALNTFPGLDPPSVTAALTAILPNCLPLGPYHLLAPATDTTAPASDPNGCIAWLDSHAPRTVAYVSFGTVAAPRPDELRELAAGLEASGAPFLWSLREDSWRLLPPGFLERTGHAGLVVPWSPQVGVLRHASVGAFVTHAGWASVMEGVSSGVPMACRPFFGDQRMNARSVSHVWGCGAAFDGAMTRDAVARAVASLVGGEEGRRMRARAQELQAKAAKAFETGGECVKNFSKFVEIVCAP
ncbi:anthocyanidin 3-O-glucosyltransferase-like [Oryza brachyantha]|uniref:anthocyanidin 3-O-glucosyltransferase-like n=1 Tax=Oryza brachyantha TaxID=4533 RepID=UPI001ADBDAB9|nr:anthocyanidin 3-O-glucosyltransferase-like [Oryza brachyantha]